jgi:hypothetical protein
MSEYKFNLAIFFNGKLRQDDMTFYDFDSLNKQMKSDISPSKKVLIDEDTFKLNRQETMWTVSGNGWLWEFKVTKTEYISPVFKGKECEKCGQEMRCTEYGDWDDIWYESHDCDCGHSTYEQFEMSF